ncbi:MAG: hypothetical protein LBE17_06410, partial [Treponema sp.]|nr:hypothetical protein [Treponema sp.]
MNSLNFNRIENSENRYGGLGGCGALCESYEEMSDFTQIEAPAAKNPHGRLHGLGVFRSMGTKGILIFS